MTKYDWAPGMPFLQQYAGGKSFPQVFSAPIDGPAPSIPTFTDDTIFAPEKKGLFQIVALLDRIDQLNAARTDIAQLKSSGSLSILDPSEATYIVHSVSSGAAPVSALPDKEKMRDNIIRVLGAEEYIAAGRTDDAISKGFPRPPPVFYDPNRIRKDIGYDKVYVIVRWDRFVFAACRNYTELKDAVSRVEPTLRRPVEISKA